MEVEWDNIEGKKINDSENLLNKNLKVNWKDYWGMAWKRNMKN